MVARKEGPTTERDEPSYENIAAELAELRKSIDQLTQGLTQLADTAETHTIMLQHLVTAVTAEGDPELAQLLQHIVSQLQGQETQLASVGEAIGTLPAEIGQAVGTELATALAAVQ